LRTAQTFANVLCRHVKIPCHHHFHDHHTVRDLAGLEVEEEEDDTSQLDACFPLTLVAASAVLTEHDAVHLVVANAIADSAVGSLVRGSNHHFLHADFDNDLQTYMYHVDKTGKLVVVLFAYDH
jgi:hypothetical protein